MATLAELRQRLARAVDAYSYGAATHNGLSNQIIDSYQLRRWTEIDELVGVTAYILSTTDGGAPQDEGRFVSAFTPTGNPMITVAYMYSVAPEMGDVYELFRVPYMGMGDWNEVVNRAIRSAWPELYMTVSTTVVENADPTAPIALPVAALAIETVILRPGDRLRGYPGRTPIRDVDYIIYGAPGSLSLLWKRPPLQADYTTEVVYRAAYPALNAATAETALDEAYIMLAARAEFYEYRANKTRMESDAATYLQAAMTFRGEAQKRKGQLLAVSSGQPLQVGGGR